MKSIQQQKPPTVAWVKVVAAIALLFGVLTVFSGGNVLFGTPAARALAGDYIPFVVWFNFLAGFVYIIAAIGVWQNRVWSSWLAFAIAFATALAMVAFAISIIRGSLFEMRTVGALSFRIMFWTAVAVMIRSGVKSR